MPALFPRLDQLLSSLGYGSRRDAAAWCRIGRVTDPAGRPVTQPDTRLDPRAVRIDGHALDHPGGIFVILHKPVGFTCSHSQGEGPLFLDLLPALWRHRHPPATSIGRLDRETSGLLLVTTLGHWVHRLSSPKHHVERTYLATTRDLLLPETAEAFASGRLLLRGEDQPCRPARLEIVGPQKALITLTEGKYHQVRRMFAACGHHVVTLHRESFGPYRLDGLAPGQWHDAPDPDGILHS